MQHKSKFQFIIHIVVVLMMLTEAVAPILAYEAQETSSAPGQGDNLVATEQVAAANPAVSPLIAEGQRRVAEQQARVEPTPVAVGEALAAGTAPNSLAPATSLYHLYLPVVILQSETEPQDIALSPDVWMAATTGWQETAIQGIADLGDVTLRYPAAADKLSLMALSGKEGFRIADGDKSVAVIVDRAAPVGLLTLARATSHPVIEQYRQAGATIHEVTVKGLPAWDIIPTAGSGVCREVLVAMPGAWLRFQLQSPGGLPACLTSEVFDLVLASIQIRVADTGQEVVLDAASEDTPMAPTEVMAINAVSYDRTVAKNYAYNWWDQHNNNDNKYYYCSGGVECDGAHYGAHFLQAGGFSIHWNAGQDHNDARVYRVTDQRSYVKSKSYVSATSRGNLKTGDIIYINGGSSWCWEQMVVRMSSGTPYISTHSVASYDKRYDLYYCGSSSDHWYEYIHIDAEADHPLPKLDSGLTLVPSAVVSGELDLASFNVHNYGAQSIALELRVTTNGGGEFPTVACTLAAGGNCAYNQTAVLTQTGVFTQTCAQMRSGGGAWQNIPQTGSGVTCRTLSVLVPADVRLMGDLELTPNELDYGGGAVQAQFIVQNTGQVTATEQFSAEVTGGAVVFDVSQPITLGPGITYTYQSTRTFTQVGVYEVLAKHNVAGASTPLIGNSSGFVRVHEQPPARPWWMVGYPTTCGYAGEPVNTLNGNYFYDFTDLSEETPGLTLEATRWYNALYASEVIGPFGYGSSWTYGMAVTWRADKTALVQMPDGHPGYFVAPVAPDNPLDMTGPYYGQERDQGNVLERAEDDSAILTMADQTQYHFDTTGRLVRITDTTPSEITLVYSDTRPYQLLHSAGFTLTLDYSDSLITRIASNTGRVFTYTYTPAGDLETVTYPDGSTYTYVYDANHRLTEARDPNGHAYVRNVYDGEGRVVRQYDQTGQESTFRYGETLSGTRNFTDALGNVITHTYDTTGFLIAEVDPLGHEITYTRDLRGNILSQRNKNGDVWHYTYDEQGNMLTETDPLGNTWTYGYDARNNLLSTTDPLGRVRVYEYDTEGRLIRTTDPLGYTHEYLYDGAGNLIWERDETGAETMYAYNALGWQTLITDALGYTTAFGYDALGRQTVVTDANGNRAYSVYDALDQLVASIDPAGAVVTFTYDAMGNLLAESDGMGHIRTSTYDAHNRIVAETDFNGNVTQYGYDALGRRTVMTDALGYTTVYTYDAAGNLAARQEPDGALYRYEYDPVGNLRREMNPLGRVTEHVYDAVGHEIETREPCDTCAGGMRVTTRVYDAVGNVVQETDPLSATTTYHYDALNRIAVVTDTYGYTMTTTYDPAGRVLQEVDALGAITRYEYDLAGNLITTTNALGYIAANAYDPVGRLLWNVNERGYTTTYAYDANDHVVALTDAMGYTTRNTYDAGGNLIAVTDPLSRTTTYTYDANGNLLTETDPRGHTTTYRYDALDRLVEILEPATCCAGVHRSIGYDAAGRVVSETNALGNTTYNGYDLAGRLITEQTPLGHTTVYTYDSADRLIATQEPTGDVWRYAYDANGNLTHSIDPLGNIQRQEYNRLGWLLREIDPLGGVTAYQYDAGSQVIALTDPRGAVTRYTYDILGRRVQETDALGYTRVYTLDAVGNLTAEQNERGYVTTYVYDPLDRLIAQTDPLGHSLFILYDAAGQMTAEADYNGNVTRYEYDAAGNQIAITDALSHTTTMVYDALNRPLAVTNALSGTAYTAYDAAGQVISDTTPGGHSTRYAYDADGLLIQEIDPLGYAWDTEYDAAGRPIRVVDPLGRAQTTTYDGLGRVIAETDALGRVTRYAYTPLGWLQQVTGPDGTTQRYTYDPVGNVLSEQDGNGHITRYEYDLGDRLLRKTDPLGRTWHYRYDPMGNLTDITTPPNGHIAHTYDALNRLTRKTYDGALATAYAYDANGNRVVMTDTLGVAAYEYDALNRLTRSGDANGRWVQTHYDALGQKVHLTYPDGAQAQYLYDSDGNLSQVTAPDGGITGYEYDALGRPVRVIQANGVTVATVYDAVGNTRDITQSAADGTIFSHIAYTLDAADRKAQTVEATFPLTGGATVVTTTYTYDDLDRLTASLSSDGRETHYAFDRAGNRTALWGARFRDAVLESYRVDYAYNAANQLLRAVDSALGATTYAYDANGNRIMERAADRWADYSYDAEGHLTVAHVKIWANGQWGYRDGIYEAYHYDGDGRRVRKETVSVALGNPILRRDYRYDDTGSGWDVLQTYDVAGTTAEARYLYDGDLHKLAYWQNGTSGYFQNDGLGSILGVTGETGAAPESLMRYGDYGELLAEVEALPTADAFTGYEYDAYTGMYYARNRTYDPTTGTFLSVDPYPPDRTDLLDLHRYLYTQANPTNMTDPLGLWSLRDAWNKTKQVATNVHKAVSNTVKSVGRTVNRYVQNTTRKVQQTVQRVNRTAQRITQTARKVARRVYQGAKSRVTQSAKYFVDRARNMARYAGKVVKHCGPRALQQVKETLNAGASYTGKAVKQALMGDFYEGSPNLLGIAGQIGIGLIPGVGQIADARDTLAAIKKMWKEPSWGNAGNLALNVIGWVPLVGDAAKSLGKAGKALKYSDEVADVVKHSDEVTDILKHSDVVASSVKKNVKKNKKVVLEIHSKYFDDSDTIKKVGQLNQKTKQGEAILKDTRNIKRDPKIIKEAKKLLNKDWSKYDVDHILDLQLGGKNVLENLQALKSGVNRSIGSSIRQQIKKLGLPPGTKIDKFVLKPLKK